MKSIVLVALAVALHLAGCQPSGETQGRAAQQLLPQATEPPAQGASPSACPPAKPPNAEASRPQAPRHGPLRRLKARLTDGTLIQVAQGRGHPERSDFIVVTTPKGSMSAVSLHPSFKELIKHDTTFGSRQARLAAQTADWIQMQGLVPAGDHALGVIDWIDDGPSGVPTVAQHLVWIQSYGEMRLMRVLRGIERSQYRMTSERLWMSRKDIVLLEDSKLKLLDILGNERGVLRSFEPVTSAFTESEGALRIEIRKPGTLNLRKRYLYNLETRKLRPLPIAEREKGQPM